MYLCSPAGGQTDTGVDQKNDVLLRVTSMAGGTLRHDAGT